MSDDDKPHFDMTELRAAAVQMHELYREMKTAGFSRSEAMEFLARMVSHSAINENNNDAS